MKDSTLKSMIHDVLKLYSNLQDEKEMQVFQKRKRFYFKHQEMERLYSMIEGTMVLLKV